MHTICLCLLYVFICYIISECIRYFISKENKNIKSKYDVYPESRLSPISLSPEPFVKQKFTFDIPKSNNRINTYKTGDIIQIVFSNDDTYSNYRHPGRRSISTYGFEEIEPEEFTDYIVTCVEEYGNIPNHKGAVNVNNSINNIDTFMYVYPKKEFEEMNGLFEHTKEIFWFINLNKMTICQFEDAYPIYNISEIIIKKSS